MIYLGTAGWSLPRAEQARFPEAPSHLARYARVFPAVEINSTFHRPHRESTFARWAQSVPPAFRFSVKLPRTITHDRKLVGALDPLDEFLASLAPLEGRVGCLLVQLPPSLQFEGRAASAFLSALRRRFDGGIAVEPRHATWFTPAAAAPADDGTGLARQLARKAVVALRAAVR